MNYILKDNRFRGDITTQIQGANRYTQILLTPCRHKFFKRPIIPVLQSVPPEM
jgi:hypothetical protein